MDNIKKLVPMVSGRLGRIDVKIARRIKLFILAFYLLVPAYIYAQKFSLDSSLLGLRIGVFLNSGGAHPFWGYQTILAPNLATFLKMDHHEFSIGLIFPAMIEAEKGYNYLREHTIGSLCGYNYYLFDPYHRLNLFLHYEFEFIYFTGRILEGSHAGYYEFDIIYEFIRNLFGIGYSLYFDRKRNFNVSMGCDYIIPYFFEKKSYDTHSGTWSTKWLDPHMNNYFNYYFNINIKIASFNKKKKL